MPGSVAVLPLAEFSAWRHRDGKERDLFSVILELTARCNNNCRHCYINLPATDARAESRELSFKELRAVMDEAAAMGALWCLVTGGEPLLRPDFEEIYRYLKRKGFLVTVFTNATLVNDRIANLFAQYPPRALEVTIYGATREVYEGVTRKSGSFAGFQRGLSRLREKGVQFNLKAMALRSNVEEMTGIAAFGRQHSKDPFRFDPGLHLRYDVDMIRNIDIIQERLTPPEIAALDRADGERFEALKKSCMDAEMPDPRDDGRRLFRCGAALNECVVGWDGRLRACSSLWHPDFLYDLRKGTIREGWNFFMSKVRSARAKDIRFINECGKCGMTHLCMNCPAHAHLETGRLESVVDYFCKIANSRKKSVMKTAPSRGGDEGAKNARDRLKTSTKQQPKKGEKR